VFDYGTKPSEDRRGSVVLQDDLKITEEDLEEIETKLGSMTLDATMDIMRQVLLLHEHDQNFPGAVLQKIKFFTQDEDVVANPAMHAELIREMKLEAILVTENSPYAEVRAVVDNTDDVDLPVGTPRAWFIGLLFVIGGAFINQLFAVRQPAITVTANVAQLLACKSFLFLFSLLYLGILFNLHYAHTDPEQTPLVVFLRSSCPTSDSPSWACATPSTLDRSTTRSIC